MVRPTKSKNPIRVLDGQDDITLTESGKTSGEVIESSNQTEEKIEVDIGLDVSTSVIGVCVLNHKTGDLISIFPVKLGKSSLEDIWDKTDYFRFNLILNLDNKWDVKRVFVEDVAKKFSSGFSSASTIVTLAKMNALACWIAKEIFNKKPTFINVRSARAVLGIKIDTKDKSKSTKEKVFEKVLALQPTFPWLQHLAKTGKGKGTQVYDVCNQDMGDAWVTCRGGQCLVPSS